MRLEFPILFMTATLCGPGGVRAVIAEHLLLKQQLLVLHRPRQRAPHLTASDRRLFGFGSLFLSPGDAGAFAFAISQRAGRALGASGQVVTVRMTPQNYDDYVEP